MIRCFVGMAISIWLTFCSGPESPTRVSQIKWHPAEMIRPPHHNIEHVVDISQGGDLMLNGAPLAPDEARTAFSHIARHQRFAYIYFRPACSDQRLTVQKFRSLIEASGACAENFCICGGMTDEDPPANPAISMPDQ